MKLIKIDEVCINPEAVDMIYCDDDAKRQINGAERSENDKNTDNNKR